MLDLSDVTQMGAAGLGELIKIYSAVRMAGGHMALSTVPGRLRFLLAATRLESAFDVFESEHRAVVSLTRQVDRGVA